MMVSDHHKHATLELIKNPINPQFLFILFNFSYLTSFIFLLYIFGNSLVI